MTLKIVNSYIPLGLILFTAWIIWEDFNFHSEEIERIKSSLPVVESKIKRKSKQRSQIKDFLKNIEEAKARVQVVADEVALVQKKLPDTISDARNLQELKVIANSLTIKKPAFTQGKEDERGFYIAKSYNFTAQGTYLQFLLFIEKVHNSDLLLNISEMSLKVPDKPIRGRYQVLNANIKLEAYRYNPKHQVDTGIDEIEEKFQSKNKKTKKKKKKK